MPPTTTPFDSLRTRLAELAALGSVQGLVAWDQETKMPPAAGAARAEQLALLAGLVHERRVSPELADDLAACEEDPALAADPAVAADLRELRRELDRARCLPKDLVQALARARSRGQEAWKAARAASDFEAFRPTLEELLELKRREAEALGVPEGGELYDALLEGYEPGARAAELEGVFGPLKERLSALIAELGERGSAPDEGCLDTPVEESAQHAFGLEVLGAMGFDLDAGRVDVAAHPFCSGMAPGDTRLTTRYADQRWADSLYGTMHEGGHGLYEQGLPKGEAFGLPRANAVSLGIHESQSRLWENLVGRSREFWVWALPRAAERFGAALDGVGVDELFRAVNTARPSFIRVDADEATYNLHIMLRFDLERALLRGDLTAAELPAAWNEGFRGLLGLEVPDDARGCLQDVHWSFGLFGYFPTYTLGNLYAAQLWEAALRELPGLEDGFARGEFLPLRDWLRAKVHAHGSRYPAGELCERATGAQLSPEPLLRHLEGRLRPVYGL
jgi:carboxypeptidase Taq